KGIRDQRCCAGTARRLRASWRAGPARSGRRPYRRGWNRCARSSAHSVSRRFPRRTRRSSCFGPSRSWRDSASGRKPDRSSRRARGSVEPGNAGRRGPEADGAGIQEQRNERYHCHARHPARGARAGGRAGRGALPDHASGRFGADRGMGPRAAPPGPRVGRGGARAPLVRAAAPAAVLSQTTQVAGSGRTAAWAPAQLHMTRESLEELLARYEQATRSTAYSEELRARARYEAGLIRVRLEEGDFQVGDQIQLAVEGQPELTSTFQVAPGRVLILPVIGEIPLKGVLRSELEDHLTKSLGRFIVEPKVRATSQIRISILGQVASPGFY